MNNLQNHLRTISNHDCIPINHKQFLTKLKESGFEPKVIYDIGSCVVQWTKFAKLLWPNATFILFDAFAPAEFLYIEEGYDYNIGVISNRDDSVVKFYQNDYLPGGNSYYREIGCDNGCDNGKHFPEDKYLELVSKKLDTIVKQKGFPLPDFVKIDVQGAEIDIIQGGLETLSHAERMIVELQHIEYNQGAFVANESLPIIESLGWKCDAPLFQNNGPDGDYSFVKSSL
jgi:FkbM family methyltransferase